MDMYRILENFDAVNSKQTLAEGAVKRELHAMADKMTKAEFVAKVKNDDLSMSPKEAADFWNNVNGGDDEELDEGDMEEGNKFAHNVLKAKAAGMKKADLDGDGEMETVREDDDEMNEAKSKDKDKEKKSPFPGSPEYEKKHGKFRHDDDSAFHKKKVSTGTVYSRKHKEEPEADDEEDKKPKKSGRPAGTKKKIGAKGPGVNSKLLKGKGGLKEHDYEMHMNNSPDSGEYDDEAGMARQDLHTVVDAAKELHDILASDENLPEWVQAKITKALDYIDTSRDYVKSSHADQGEEEIDEAAGQQFKKGDPVTYGKSQMIFYAYDPQNPEYVYLQSPGQTATQAASLSGVKPAAAAAAAPAAAASSFKKGDKVIANGAPATVYNIDAANNTAYVQYEADLAKGSPQTQAVVLNQLKPAGVAEASDDQLDQQKMSQMKRAAAARANSRRVQQKPPSGGPRRSDIPAGIRRARGDAPLGRDEVNELSPATLKSYQDKAAASAGQQVVTPAGSGKFGQRLGGLMRAGDRLSKQPEPEVKETSMGGTVAGGMAPAAGQKTFAEASSGSHEVAWKAAGKAVHAIMKKRGYTGSKTEEGYMWTRQTPRGTAFVDIDFDERDPDTARWGEGELKGAKNKSYYQSGNDNVSDLAQVIGELFANVKLGQSGMDEADEDGKKDKPNFAKKKPDDDGDGVPDWADKKPGSDDNEESDDSEESDDDSEDKDSDDKELKLMKSRAGIADKDDDSDDKESDDDSEDDDSDDTPEKGKKPDFGKSDDKESDKDDSDDDSEDDETDEDDSQDKKESKDESADKPKKSGGMKVGTGVYESAFNKSLKSHLRESINMNTSQDSDGKKSVTVTASDEDADKLGDLLKMAGLFSSEGYSSVCQNCGGIHEADACGADHVEEDLANSPDEMYTDADYMTQTLSGGLNGPKTTGQTTIPVINRQDSRQGVMAEADKITEQAKTRLWNMYKQYDTK